MAKTTEYRTIKSLVLDHVHRHAGNVEFDTLTEEVRKCFPESKWKKTHWAWYRHQIVRGRFRDLFTAEERAALSQRKAPDARPQAPTKATAVKSLARGPKPRDKEVKRIGDAVLNHVRFVLSEVAGDDVDKRFKLNRWVFSRLLQDEIRIKRPIKKKLWDGGMRSCQACGQNFASTKRVEIHRKNESTGYSIENCELLCRECHQELG